MGSRVLGLGTFPVAKPVHGGQRRISAIRSFYRSLGIEYEYACVHEVVYGLSGLVGPHDIQFGYRVEEFDRIPLVNDYLSGLQAADDEATFAHFVRVIETVKPDALQLEHPFMWPLVKKLAGMAQFGHLPLIYSSHNVEAPLKRMILLSWNVSASDAHFAEQALQREEAEVAAHADFIICVSRADADHYLKTRAPTDVVIVPNGVDRPPTSPIGSQVVREAFGDNRFVLTVGADYPPNVEGVATLIMKDGAFHGPPMKSLAVCGGVANGVRGHELYQRFASANECRVAFFPTIEDDDLWALKTACWAAATAVGYGGGSSLKMAEALTLGKWVVANSVALRGFETFADEEGLIVADTRAEFRRAMARALGSDPVVLSEASRKKRDMLYWDNGLANSSLHERLSRLL